MPKIIYDTYELLEQLGQGGMGVVYKARHIRLGKFFAVKRLWEQFSTAEKVKELFFSEGKFQAQLQHHNIVQVSDLFKYENSYYIVMEFIEGRTLSEIIKNEVGPIELKRAIMLFSQILDAVAHIQSQPKPLIHRDLKPLNILVTKDDIVKITDFGIAKEFSDGLGTSTTMKGTPVYMSPEQIMDPKSVDIRTDIYSLGMTFYEMLCGRTPFPEDQSTTPTAIYTQIVNDKIPPPTSFYKYIPDPIVDIVMKAIHKDKAMRFANAAEMLRELEKLEMSGATTVQGPITPLPPVVQKPEHEIPTNVGGKETVIETETQQKKEENEFKVASRYLVGGFVVLVLFILLSYGLTGGKKVKVAEMIAVEGGTFQMGSTDGDPDEKPTKQVTVSSFMMGKYEVTQALWESVMGSNPSRFKGSDRPIEKVSWYDAVEFCNKLSEKEGLTPVYKIDKTIKDPNNRYEDDDLKWQVTADFTTNGYRLPTEAEWEYAARGGNKSRGYKYSGSDDLDVVGWYGNNSGSQTKKIDKKQPNELGIYDMSGNVWEWCWDWHGDYSFSSNSDPRDSNSGYYRVFRGGSWYSVAEYCRVADRNGSTPVDRYYDLGFRLVRTR